MDDNSKSISVHLAPDALSSCSLTATTVIEQAMSEQCGIRSHTYFVAALSEGGEPEIFVSPYSGIDQVTARQFFDGDKFRQIMGSFGTVHTAGRRSEPRSCNQLAQRSWRDNNYAYNLRNRGRAQGPVQDLASALTSSTAGIRVGNSEAIRSFYECCFNRCQQAACKFIAKVWIRAVEPKKQSKYPYSGGDGKAPPWWPKPWGLTGHQRVRHREPDHLYKRERVHLLIHLLRLAVEPKSTQHEAIRRVGLNVRKLKNISMDCLTSLLSNSEADTHRKSFIYDLFDVAAQEERYKAGEIDGLTRVHLRHEDLFSSTFDVTRNDATSAMGSKSNFCNAEIAPCSETKTPIHVPDRCVQSAMLDNDQPWLEEISPQMPIMSTVDLHQQLPASNDAGSSCSDSHVRVNVATGVLDPSRQLGVLSNFAGPLNDRSENSEFHFMANDLYNTVLPVFHAQQQVPGLGGLAPFSVMSTNKNRNSDNLGR